MEFRIAWLDVAPYLASGEQPVYVMERPLRGNDDPRDGAGGVAVRTGEYWIPNIDLLAGDAEARAAWALTNQGDYIRIPVFAYRTSAKARSAVLVTGIELGVRAAAVLAVKHRRVPSEVVLVIGTDCDVVPDGAGGEAYRCFVGAAFRAA